ncbi:hypothetical protein [Streptomyces marispadix]|uniref:Uncharacterized protein n=1 Tax=Streptomyces marispadix TaxID=2922868 RepID=A0ABS9SXI4_9ACTN|nr:hypothetical protein [Streptomyces marispadix]MCH6160913.1 hypothetical protein [Streptomyces marispadix]
MTETTQSTVKDIEDDIETTSTDDNHSPISPEKDGVASAEDGDVTTLDNHSPIAPPRGRKTSADEEAEDEGDVTTLDNHSPIAPPLGGAQ